METPFPPIHGGRVDIWRRIVALSNLGTEIQLISWSQTPSSKEEVLEINTYVKDFYPIIYGGGLSTYIKRGLCLFRYPLQVTSRIIQGKQWKSLLQKVDQFAPDIILADHVHCGFMARDLSRELSKPFVVRSHDIEHLHYTYWLKSAKGFNKLKLALALLHLKPYEISVLQDSSAFYDISVDDLKFWEEKEIKNGRFLAPLMDISDSSIVQHDSQNSDHHIPIQKIYDVVFLGNLRTENNIAGVIWFLKEVLPKIQVEKPDLKVLISGSNPVKEIFDACKDLHNVTLIPNPISAKDTYRSGKVLINPVAVGSGTSIKSIDMLAFSRPIVTLEKGLFGLPKEARQYFRVASDADSFSHLVLDSLSSTELSMPTQGEIEKLFGYPVIKELLRDLELIVKAN